MNQWLLTPDVERHIWCYFYFVHIFLNSSDFLAHNNGLDQKETRGNCNSFSTGCVHVYTNSMKEKF